MAKSHHQFAKRQRELAKKKKKEEKRRRKLEQQSNPTDEEVGQAPEGDTLEVESSE